MKRILLALCLIALLAVPVQSGNVVTFFAASAAPSYPGFDYDVYENFEDALAGDWSEVDTGSVLTPNSANAEYTGTYGMEYTSGTTATSYAKYSFGAGVNSVSFGFWIKTGAYGGWAGDRYAGWILNDSQGSIVSLREGNSSGDDSRRASLYIGALIQSPVITIADNTWYYFTGKFVRNGTGSFAVYNTSGEQVGSTVTATCPDYQADDIAIGGAGTESTTAIYYDDAFIDITDATFPLGPPVGTP